MVPNFPPCYTCTKIGQRQQHYTQPHGQCSCWPKISFNIYDSASCDTQPNALTSTSHSFFVDIMTDSSYNLFTVFLWPGAYVPCMLQARDSLLLRIQSLPYRLPGLPGKDYIQTTEFFPANFVTLFAMIWLDSEGLLLVGMYTPNNIKS